MMKNIGGKQSQPSSAQFTSVFMVKIVEWLPWWYIDGWPSVLLKWDVCLVLVEMNTLERISKSVCIFYIEKIILHLP
jgi:hypothetical protein